MPRSSLEVLLSSTLMEKMKLKVGDSLYFSALTKIVPLKERYQNIFKTKELKVVGVVEDKGLNLYQENTFPLILMNVHYALDKDLKIEKFVLSLKSNNEEYLSLLNEKYPDYKFTNPLKIYLNSLEKGLNYLSFGLLVFSLITMISAQFMMILVNYLFLQENEREIAIYTFLGYSKKSILTMFLFLGIFFFLASFILTSISLIITSFIIPFAEDTLSNFKVTYLPFLLIFLVELIALFIVLSFTYFSFRKKDVIEMIKK